MCHQEESSVRTALLRSTFSAFLGTGRVPGAASPGSRVAQGRHSGRRDGHGQDDPGGWTEMEDAWSDRLNRSFAHRDLFLEAARSSH